MRGRLPAEVMTRYTCWAWKPPEIEAPVAAGVAAWEVTVQVPWRPNSFSCGLRTPA